MNELVASWVPTRANQHSDRPASREIVDLSERRADLLAALHVAARGRDHDAALDEAGELVDLRRVVGAVGHRDDHDVGAVACSMPKRIACAGPRP